VLVTHAEVWYFAVIVPLLGAIRYRLLGHPVHFQTGTDEHGQKVQEAAAQSGEAPQVKSATPPLPRLASWHEARRGHSVTKDRVLGAPRFSPKPVVVADRVPRCLPLTLLNNPPPLACAIST